MRRTRRLEDELDVDEVAQQIADIILDTLWERRRAGCISVQGQGQREESAAPPLRRQVARVKKGAIGVRGCIRALSRGRSDRGRRQDGEGCEMSFSSENTFYSAARRALQKIIARETA